MADREETASEPREECLSAEEQHERKVGTRKRVGYLSALHAFAASSLLLFAQEGGGQEVQIVPKPVDQPKPAERVPPPKPEHPLWGKWQTREGMVNVLKSSLSDDVKDVANFLIATPGTVEKLIPEIAEALERSTVFDESCTYRLISVLRPHRQAKPLLYRRIFVLSHHASHDRAAAQARQVLIEWGPPTKEEIPSLLELVTQHSSAGHYTGKDVLEHIQGMGEHAEHALPQLQAQLGKRLEKLRQKPKGQDASAVEGYISAEDLAATIAIIGKEKVIPLFKEILERKGEAEQHARVAALSAFRRVPAKHVAPFHPLLLQIVQSKGGQESLAAQDVLLANMREGVTNRGIFDHFLGRLGDHRVYQALLSAPAELIVPELTAKLLKGSEEEQFQALFLFERRKDVLGKIGEDLLPYLLKSSPLEARRGDEANPYRPSWKPGSKDPVRERQDEMYQLKVGLMTKVGGEINNRERPFPPNKSDDDRKGALQGETTEYLCRVIANDRSPNVAVETLTKYMKRDLPIDDALKHAVLKLSQRQDLGDVHQWMDIGEVLWRMGDKKLLKHVWEKNIEKPEGLLLVMGLRRCGRAVEGFFEEMVRKPAYSGAREEMEIALRGWQRARGEKP